MPDITLTAKPTLGGYTQNTSGVSVTEQTSLSLVSIASPLNGDETLRTAAKGAFNVDLPDVGRIETSGNGSYKLLGLQPQQWFIAFEDNSNSSPITTIKEPLGNTAYCTDQSDSWVTFELTGPKVLEALERICPIDIRRDRFSVGTVARTTMEHLGVIIARVGEDQYWLMSASSSAESFLHAITTSVNNISNN